MACCVLSFAHPQPKELRGIRKINVIRAGNGAFYFGAAVLSSFLSFLCYVLVGNDLTATKVFMSLAVFAVVRVEVAYFLPLGILVRLSTREGVAFDFSDFPPPPEH